MMGRKLIACLAALTAMATFGCSSSTSNNDAGTTPDAGGPVCKPKCAADHYCDDLQNDPPACLSVCTDTAAGCLNGLVCDVVSKTCKAPSCGGEQCEQGQGCYDPSSIVSGAVAGDTCTCIPALTTGQKDSCAAFGMVCSITDPQNPVATKCTKPGEFDHCDKKIGCQTGFDCNPTFLQGDTGNICTRKCTKIDDCPNPQMKCWPNNAQLPAGIRNHCYYNICGTDANNNIDRTQYWKPCPAAATADGQCLPYTDPQTGEDVVGICYQTGTAPALGDCSSGTPTARAAKAEMCPQNQMCEMIQPASPSHKGGICRALCNAAPGPNKTPAPACDANTVCADETGTDSSGTMGKEARVGFCRQSCDLLGTSNTCSDDVLGNHAGCQGQFSALSSTGICRSMVATPNETGGGPCNYYYDAKGGDFRMDCDDRLICLNDNVCHQWCDRRVCTDTAAACAQCPTGQGCQDTEQNQDHTKNPMGWCVTQ